MSINKNNIAAFITYLYKTRKNEQPPTELLSRWQSLSDDEITTQLSGLFQSWGMSEAEKNEQINLFYQQSLYTPAPEAVAPRPIPPPPPKPQPQRVAQPGRNSIIPTQNKRKSNWPVVAIVAVVVLAGLFLGYKFLQYKSLDYIYTITDNVSVRNENKEMVATMDLFEVKKELPSYQKLKAFDSKIYYRSIDESDKKFPFRKVMLGDAGFWAFLTNDSKIAGYVNTNYVVDNQNEFNLYQNAFKEVKTSKVENANLKAIYRKIIIGSMGMDASFSDKFIVTNTNNLSRSVIDKTYAIMKQTIVDNVKYIIIAGLSDGNYYRFEGDIKENTFEAPEKVEVRNGIDNPMPLTGSYRFFNKGKLVYLYDCKANVPLNFEAIRDDKGRYIAFEYKAPVDSATTAPDTVIAEE